MEKETAMKILKELHDNSLFSNRTALETIIPELKESEDEKIRKALIHIVKGACSKYGIKYQGQEISEEKLLAWLKKQGTPAKLSEEEQNRYAKVVLTSCAESFIKYLDAHKYEGKMCVSNGECEDIENAFHNAMWDRLHRYYCKYIEKQGEQKLCMIQWKGDNLKEVINFTGKDKNFDKWFTSFEEYEKYVREHNDIFKLFNEDGSHYEVPVGAWIIKTPDGRNVASKAVLKQKLADKTEPKFKVGDWIIHQGTNNIYQVVAVIDNQYQLKYGDNYTIQNCADVDRCARLWDITKDAKKGDVLRHNGCTFIFICIEKGVVKGLEENLYNGTKACNLGEPNKNNDYSPATKEQRDILMKAMADAGFEWNDSIKELKKINSYCQENCKGYQETGKCFADGGCDAKRKAEQESVETPRDYHDIDPHFGIPVEDLMSKEKKTVNKKEPKFHEGEWIVWKNKCYKVNYNDCGYELIDQNGLSTSLEYGTVDTSARLYDVTKDAKDGDVLAAKSGNRIFLYNGNCDLRHRPCAYCGTYKGFSEILFSKCAIGNYFTDEDVYPATKKQRDLLFQKMKESGYEWDAEKKELKIVDWSKHIKYEPNSPSIVEHKQEWSEEDENYLQSAENACEYQYGKNTSTILWLKSLKDRVQPQPKQEWSEEDEFRLSRIVENIELLNDANGNILLKDIEWLKSLKERITWKPSEKQMEALHNLNLIGKIDYTGQAQALIELYNDLKKL